MSTPSSVSLLQLEQLKLHLTTERYAPSIQRLYLCLARYFLNYLENKNEPVNAFRETELEEFLRWELRRFRKRNARAPRHLIQWRWRYISPLRMILRLVHGHWPIAAEPRSPLEAFHRDVTQGYDAWMRDLRGLAAVTRSARIAYALEFLGALGSHSDKDGLMQLSVGQIDAYVLQRSKGLSRATMEGHTVCLRSLLRYLHGSGRTTHDLSPMVIGPRIYEHEQIPSALRADDVKRMLEVVRQDHSPAGRRDYAFLMLLATYGLRAGEIVKLRLEDIDWRKETLHVGHSKTGGSTELPLLPEPGEAVLSYLQEVRPESRHREVFLHLQAPYRPYKGGSTLHCVTTARLKAAGIIPFGRHGPHALRHARAVSLLRATVSLKTIGDVLGHKSVRSTAVYLKLATTDLRGVGLDLPSGIRP